MSRSVVRLVWQCFSSMTDARAAFWETPCIYAQADATGRVVRVGKASQGLNARYRGGTCWALDAAMHDSRNLVFVAAVAAGLCATVESVLIRRHREQLGYNNHGKARDPRAVVELQHRGKRPIFDAL